MNNTKSPLKIGACREERAAIRCLESIINYRAISKTIAKLLVTRSAKGAGPLVSGNNLSSRYNCWLKPIGHFKQVMFTSFIDNTFVIKFNHG